MTRTARLFAGIAALSLSIATVIGALASHALPALLEGRALATLQTANAYQFYHSLGLLGIAILAARNPGSRWFEVPGWLLVAGLILFCGSVYATAFGAPAASARIAPVGGSSLIAAWLVLAIGVFMGRHRG